jgi:predicted RNA binding protein YcfA (HicA-like mRNA interferase family)
VLFTDVSAERAVRALSKVGFKIVMRGKHIGMSDGVHRITIPDHRRLNPYTLKAIIKDAGLKDEVFKTLLLSEHPVTSIYYSFKLRQSVDSLITSNTKRLFMYTASNYPVPVPSAM